MGTLEALLRREREAPSLAPGPLQRPEGDCEEATQRVRMSRTGWTGSKGVG